MRSALILDRTVDALVEQSTSISLSQDYEDDIVAPLEEDLSVPAVSDVKGFLSSHALAVYNPQWFCCRFVGPHTDSVGYPYTLGMVVRGGGMLFTGNGRNVGLLSPGKVYVLDNTKLHGLKSVDGFEPMVFAAMDFLAENFAAAKRLAEDAVEALSGRISV
jgi:hypothetical protein